MNVILTELQMPQHSTPPFSSPRKSETCEGKRQRRIQTWRQFKTLVGFAERARANTVKSENLQQVPITRATLPLKIAIMMTTRLNPQMPIKHTTIRLTLGSEDGEEPLDDDDGDEENDTFSSYVPLDDATVF